MAKVSYQTKRAMAAIFNSMPIKDDLPGQKFKRGDKVRVEKLPRYMAHFPSECNAIVEYTYGQKFFGFDNKSYCLSILNDEGLIINEVSWYPESILTKIGKRS